MQSGSNFFYNREQMVIGQNPKKALKLADFDWGTGTELLRKLRGSTDFARGMAGGMIKKQTHLYHHPALKTVILVWAYVCNIS